MRWTDDDGDDIQAAADCARTLAAALEEDARLARARPGTRARIDAALEALLALDDVYFEGVAGERLPEVWRRARLTVRRT